MEEPYREHAVFRISEVKRNIRNVSRVHTRLQVNSLLAHDLRFSLLEGKRWRRGNAELLCPKKEKSSVDSETKRRRSLFVSRCETFIHETSWLSTEPRTRRLPLFISQSFPINTRAHLISLNTVPQHIDWRGKSVPLAATPEQIRARTSIGGRCN